jgi:UTP--glucose-1-phosphate uridylyltransferase
MSSLANAIAAIPSAVRARLEQHGFQEARLVELGERLSRGADDRGLATGRIEPPRAQDVVTLPRAGSEERRKLEGLGEEALAAGKVALVVLAGGMATRMGGVVKALVEALPGSTFLDLRKMLGYRKSRLQPIIKEKLL